MYEHSRYIAGSLWARVLHERGGLNSGRKHHTFHICQKVLNRLLLILIFRSVGSAAGTAVVLQLLLHFFLFLHHFFLFLSDAFPLDTFDDLLLLLCPSHSYSGKPKLTQSKLPSCSKQGVIEGLGEAQGEVVCRGEAEQGGEGGRGGGAAGEVLGIRSPKPGEVAVL